MIVLFGWWRGLHFTTILRRRLAMMGRRGKPARSNPVLPQQTTALLRVGPPIGDADVLPLPLIAGYLDRYGIRADKIRITSRDNTSDPSRRETWIGITMSAADNLAALQARSSQIPLHETAEVAARRLADHLREIGWEASTVGTDDVPRLLSPNARETWARCSGAPRITLRHTKSAWTTRCPRRWRRSGRTRPARPARRWRSPAAQWPAATRSRPRARSSPRQLPAGAAPLAGLIAAARKPAAGAGRHWTCCPPSGSTGTPMRPTACWRGWTGPPPRPGPIGRPRRDR